VNQKKCIVVNRLISVSSESKKCNAALAGGTAAAAREGGVLADPPAHSSTSPWWTLVTPKPCTCGTVGGSQTFRQCDPLVQKLSRSPGKEGFQSLDMYANAKISRFGPLISLSKTQYPPTTLMMTERDLCLMSSWRLRDYGQESGGSRAFKLTADSRETTQGKGARWTTTNHVDVEPHMGARHDATHIGEEPQQEEWHGLAAEVPGN
jgi:hypothetical protein